MITRTAIAGSSPQRLKMSYEEYLDYADNTRIIEWVGGEALIYMPPIYEHQSIVTFLLALLKSYTSHFNSGVILTAPFEVKLWPGGPAREPDLFFIAKARLEGFSSRRFEGGPDLIIEVISPGSAVEDRVRKFSEYERAGVGEYWLIDPRPHQEQADFYILKDGRLTEAAVDENGIFYSHILPNFWLNPHWLWPANQPNPQLALAEIMLAMAELPEDVKTVYQGLYNILRPE
jgi:Uma2 family endonuclease